MIIRSSHLALRFYVTDGWTLEAVEKYLRHPAYTEKSIELCFENTPHAYFRFSLEARVDCEKILADGHTVQRWGDLENNVNNVSDLEYLRSLT